MAETFLIVVTQIAMLFLLIGMGYFLCKKDVLNDTVRKGVTTVLLDVVTPCVILKEMQTERTADSMKGLVWSAGIYAVYLMAAILLSRLLAGKSVSRGETAAKRICMVYTNCGFMGLPLLAALSGLVGEKALFYGSVIIAVNNLFIFTQGIGMFGGKPGLKGTLKLMLTPAVISVFIGAALFFTGVTLPEVVNKPIAYLADMNTPMAMLVIGAILCKSDLRKVFADKRIWWPVALRNLLFPLLFVLSVWGLSLCVPLEDVLFPVMTCLVIASCPVAGNCAIFAERYGGDSCLASGIFSASTLLSAVTLPVVIALAGVLL